MKMELPQGMRGSSTPTLRLQGAAATKAMEACRMRNEFRAVQLYVNTARAHLCKLEAMSDLSGRPVAELVAPPGTIYQLNAEEAAIIRRLRLWPASVMRALGAFLAFFADEPPEVRLSRNMHELWRGLETRDREWLFGIAVMLRERSLAPDHLAGLVEQLKAEAATAAKAKRRRDDA